MDRILKPGECIDALGRKGLKIIRSPYGFQYGTDQVLLAHFANIKSKSRICDLGAGGGILSFLLYGRCEGVAISALELDGEQADRMRRSVLLNGLEAHISVTQGDMRLKPYAAGSFDAVVCNPPYHLGAHAQGMPPAERQARTETHCTFGDAAAAAGRLLRNGGHFVTMCPASRLAEMVFAIERAHLRLKRMRLVQAAYGKAPYLCLLDAMRGAKAGLAIQENLVLNDADGHPTKELTDIYGEEKQA